ncbi:hypothetical protein FQR65_LT03474 [Abscondita terminalis]|nr:hypothetical protein FQR65_LT03474 [Abscondita terminalis]
MILAVEASVLTEVYKNANGTVLEVELTDQNNISRKNSQSQRQNINGPTQRAPKRASAERSLHQNVLAVKGLDYSILTPEQRCPHGGANMRAPKRLNCPPD